jgi:hypothetical protein
VPIAGLFRSRSYIAQLKAVPELLLRQVTPFA